MNVVIGTEAAQFLLWKCINAIFFAVQLGQKFILVLPMLHTGILLSATILLPSLLLKGLQNDLIIIGHHFDQCGIGKHIDH